MDNTTKNQCSEIVCDNCGSDGRFIIKIETFNIFECNRCQLRYLNPQPSDEFLKNFYSKSYYDNYTTEGYLAEGVEKRPDWSDGLNFIESKINNKTANLLEVGSACGFFLKYCKERGWNNLTGLEYSEWSSNYARDNFNLNIITGDLNNINLEENQFDVIVMWATIEHLRFPKNTLTNVFKLLKPGGLFVFNTGNDSKLFRWAITGYSMWYDVPAHLFFYNPKSIRFLLRTIGYNNIQVKEDKVNFNILWRLIAHKIIDVFLNSPKLKKRAMYGKLMTISACKPN